MGRVEVGDAEVGAGGRGGGYGGSAGGGFGGCGEEAPGGADAGFRQHLELKPCCYVR